MNEVPIDINSSRPIATATAQKDLVELSCQGMEKMVEELKAISPYKRETGPDGKETLISPEGEKFFVERITDPEDPTVLAVQTLIENTFSANEVDSFETTKEAIRSNSANYFVIKNESGELVTLSCTSFENVVTPDGDTFDLLEPKQGVVSVGFIITEPRIKNKNLAKELYQSFYKHTISEARQNQSIIKGVVGESVEKVEKLLNKMNRKRMYFTDQDGNVQEIKYICPPLIYDDEKSIPISDTAPEHLMFKAVDNQQEITTKDLLSIVKTIYKTFYIFDSLQNEKSQEVNVKTVLEIYHNFEKELQQAQDGKIFLMSATERAEKKVELEAKGKKLIDFVLDNSSDSEESHEQKVEQSCQKMEQIIEDLKKISPYQRITEPDGKETITSPEGEKFSIKRITNPEDPDVKEIHSFLVKTFTEDETDPLEKIKKAIETTDYYIVKNEKGELVALSCTSFLNSLKPEGDTFDPIEPKESILFTGYFLTEPAYQSKGLARELYQSAYSSAISGARKNQSVIKGIIGENVETVEKFLNKMNRKRMYFNDENGNVQEVKYICPPLNWDDEKATPISSSTPEHLMYRSLDNQQEITTLDLLSMVKTIYKKVYIVRTLQNENAKEANTKLVLETYHQLEEQLKQATDGKLFLMSAEQRDQKRIELESQGKKLIDSVLD